MGSFAIDLPLRNEWENVERVRASVESVCLAMGRSAERGQAVGMVVAELLENAIKYGDWSRSEHFRFRLWGESERAFVVVENPVRDDDPEAAILARTMEWIEGFATPAEAYRASMLASAEGAPASLGIVRILYEGRCSLRIESSAHLLRVIGELPLDDAS